MLTPDRIKEKTFQTSGRGSYRAEDVDSFFREVSASYEQMFKENTDLIKKISVFAKKIEEYRADEDSLKMALLNAQKLADKIVAEAKETAANEVAAVKGETDKLRADAASDAAALELNAKNESEAMLSSARKESAELLANAKADAEKLIDDAKLHFRPPIDICFRVHQKPRKILMLDHLTNQSVIELPACQQLDRLIL